MALNQFLVLGVIPANNEQEIAVNSTITISFAKHMDVNTLTEANIKLRKVNGEYIPYTSSYSYETYTLILTPSSLLDGDTQYQIEIVGGTTGIKSVTGDYTSTRTYEFTTVLTKSISQPQNLVVTQQGSRISASWNAPAITNDGEQITYNVRVSSSKDPNSPYLWPVLPIGTEYEQSGTSLAIEQDFETGRSYYVMVRATSVADSSDWAITQIYLEPPVVTNPDTPSTGEPAPILEQIDILEVYPSSGSIVQEDTVLVAFSDVLDALPVNALYVVEAPYKPVLSKLDLLTTYSVSKAIPGTVSLVESSVLQWKATDELPLEKEYVVIVSKDIKGISMDSLGVTAVSSFRTPWERMYGDIQVIKDKLGELSDSISDSSIYDSMRVNTLFAYDTISATNSFDSTQFENGEAPYYVHQYVNLQTAYDVLINGMTRSGGSNKEGFTLGQLQVTKEIDSSSATTLLSTIKSEIKPWLDMIHGLRNRGYAKPVGAVKGETGATYPDYLTRSELKTNFDV